MMINDFMVESWQELGWHTLEVWQFVPDAGDSAALLRVINCFYNKIDVCLKRKERYCHILIADAPVFFKH